jgi:hypothetical protein
MYLLEGGLDDSFGIFTSAAITAMIPPDNLGAAFFIRDYTERDTEGVAIGAITQITHRNPDQSDTAISFTPAGMLGSTGIVFDDALSSVTATFAVQDATANFTLQIIGF